jgi:protein-disulfide isomerase
MFRKKTIKNKSYLVIVAAVILIAAIVAAITSSHKKAINQDTNIVNLPNNIKDAQAQSYTTAKVPIVKDDDKMLGSDEAPLKVFVYEDYTNEFSTKLAETLDKIKAESGNQIGIIFRPYILENSPFALQAAVAVDCAGEQDKWLEMRALLFAQAKNQELTADNFNNYAQQIDLDENKFATCLTNPQKSERIEQSVAEAAGYGVQGAPAMFINDEMILGARPYDDFIDSNGDKIQGLKTLIGNRIK